MAFISLIGCLPFPFALLFSSSRGGGVVEILRLFAKAAPSGRTLPACMSRSLLSEAGAGSWARILCFNESPLVELALVMERIRSGFDVEKRTTRSTGMSFGASILQDLLTAVSREPGQCSYDMRLSRRLAESIIVFL